MSQVSSLYSIYQSHLERSPDQTMLIEHDRTISYRQFDQQVNACASWLSKQGIQPGDRVAVWLVNRVEWLVLLFALSRLGATLVAVNTKYRSHEVHYILSHSQASVLILQLHFLKIDFANIIAEVDASTLPHLQKILIVDATPHTPATLLGKQPIAIPADLIQAEPVPLEFDQSEPDSSAVFFTTSGTTKGPKLVMHTQRTLSTHAGHVATGYELTHPDNKLIAGLPFCGVFGLNSALAAIKAGIPVVIMDFFDVATATTLIQKHNVTHIFGSDEMLRMFVQHLAKGANPTIPFPSLKLFGFASFSPRYVDLANELIPRGFPMRGLYGSSEVHALFSLQKASLPVEDRAQGGGYPAAGPLANLRARDPETNQLCPPGIAGEIEIKSPTLFRGYFNNPSATAEAFTEDGYFKTGDLGYVREDGSFVYQSRMGDTMRIGGFLVDPSEIEHVLAEQPEIKSAQVVGIEIEGKLRPVAFVIKATAEEPSVESILNNVAHQLAKFKVPARLWFVDEFPATASANGLKFQRVKLREMALAQMSIER